MCLHLWWDSDPHFQRQIARSAKSSPHPLTLSVLFTIEHIVARSPSLPAKSRTEKIMWKCIKSWQWFHLFCSRRAWQAFGAPQDNHWITLLWDVAPLVFLCCIATPACQLQAAISLYGKTRGITNMWKRPNWCETGKSHPLSFCRSRST